MGYKLSILDELLNAHDLLVYKHTCLCPHCEKVLEFEIDGSTLSVKLDVEECQSGYVRGSRDVKGFDWHEWEEENPYPERSYGGETEEYGKLDVDFCSFECADTEELGSQMCPGCGREIEPLLKIWFEGYGSTYLLLRADGDWEVIADDSEVQRNSLEALVRDVIGEGEPDPSTGVKVTLDAFELAELQRRIEALS